MNKLVVALSPHIRFKDNTQTIMFDVLIALLPCILAGLIFFGYRSIVLLCISLVSSVFFEWIACKLIRRESSIWNLSAIVSAVILTMNLPATAPLWLPIIGSAFMILIAKMCFGGLGQNITNPAATGIIFLTICFPTIMYFFSAPFAQLWLLHANIASSATPLALAKANAGSDFLPSYLTLYFGQVSGTIGGTSGFAAIIGFLYLLWRKVIKWEIPLVFVVTVIILSLMLGKDPVFNVLSGGLLFGAVFMATDYVTSPISRIGNIIFGIGLGILTCVIRFWGSFGEGVCFAIVIMNILVPLIDKIKPRRFGILRKRIKNE